MITLSSYGKINLSIDVKGVLPSGMHQVDMIMHQINFHDDITVGFITRKGRSKGEIDVAIKTNKPYIPLDRRNIAYKAAELMINKYGQNRAGGTVTIEIVKRIPVSAGMAGGSGNGAAVLHALNVVWKLGLSLSELCEMSKELGSDVPFCVMAQAKENFSLPQKIRKDPLASSCARAEGTGTDLTPVKGIKKNIVIAKPPILVSTAGVYKKIDQYTFPERPDNDRLVKALNEGHWDKEVEKDCINVLENYTLDVFPEVKELKDFMKSLGSFSMVLMSGSGPTVFGITENRTEAVKACNALRQKGYEAYWAKTTR